MDFFIPLKGGGGPPQSKTLRGCLRSHDLRKVLDCASPLALSSRVAVAELLRQIRSNTSVLNRSLCAACFVVLALMLIFFKIPALADDWPRLGGLGESWISPETNLARSWPTNGPPMLWTAEVGEGFAGPSVYGGNVYLLDRSTNHQDVLRCFSLSKGTESWRVGYDAPGSLPYNGSRDVPTVGETCIYTVGPFGHMHCFDRSTHRVLWQHHLVDDFKDPQIDTAEPPKNREDTLARAQVPMWGLTQAPLLYRETVIVAPQTRKVGLVAYHKSSGKIRWTSGYIGRNWYSHVSPYLPTLCRVDQIIMLAQPSDPEKSPSDAPPAIISSVDANTGHILWTNLTPAPDKIPISEPVALGNDQLFI